MSRKDRNAETRPRAPKHGTAKTGSVKNRWPLARMILLLGGLLLAFGLGVAVWRDSMKANTGARAVASGAAVGGPFQMVDQNGRAANENLLRGRWSAVFFGYTFCPDVCPATLSALKLAKEKAGPKARNLQVVFVSIDPERDTPAQLRAYLSTSAFPQPIVGLTGTPAQVAAMAKAYKVYYARQDQAGSKPGARDYLMAHSSGVYLMDPQGQFRTLVSDQAGVDDMASQISEAVGHS